MFLRHSQNILKSSRLRGFRAFSQSHSRVATPRQLATLRQFPATGFEHIPISEKIEEECLDWYTPQSFYPVRIGDVFNSRYQVLYKVGYGTTSTLWMCRDLYSADYVCMKAMVCDYPSVEREVKAYEALSKAAVTSTMSGQNFVRNALDHFELKIEDRNYPCLIHNPLGLNMGMLLCVFPGNLDTAYIRWLARDMLSALEFLHSAQVVHGDIEMSNILLRIGDDSLLKETEEVEFERPSRRRVTEHSAIFESRDYIFPPSRWLSNRDPFVLCDLGEARTGSDSYTGLIQPAPFRAPEVFLNIPWGTPVDIWNFGCMVWNMMFDNFLFSRRSCPDEKTDETTGDKNQLAWMAAFLGPPPPELLDQSGSRALEFFHEDGRPRVYIPNQTLESFLASSMNKNGRKMAPEDAKMFLAFMRKAITWTQDTRASASELLSDPWISKTGADS